MDLNEMVDERLVRFDFAGTTKDEVLHNVARLLYEAHKVGDYDEYVKGLYKREKEFVTGIGGGIAIPHCKADCVKKAAFTLVKLKNSIDWGALDDQPVNYVIMLSAPDSPDADNEHLKILSKLSCKLMDDDFREGLMNAKTIEDIHTLMKGD